MDDGKSNANPVHEFAIPEWYRLVFGALGFGLCFLAIVPPAIVFGFGLGEKQGVSREVEIAAKIASILGACGAVAAGVYQFRIASRLHTKTICLDESGLWYKRASKKDGLVSWRQVSAVKDRGNQGRLDLIDQKGSKLIGIEIQVKDFEILRELILSKVRLGAETQSVSKSPSSANREEVAAASQTSRTSICEARFGNIDTANLKGGFFALCIMGMGIGAFFIPAPEGKPAWAMPLVGLGLLALIPFGVREHLKTVCQVDLRRGQVILSYPNRRRELLSQDIDDLQLADKYARKGRRLRVNTLILTDGEEITLSGLGDPEQLHHAIRKAIGRLLPEEES